MRRKQLRSEHGFAMIEAVIAMGIVGLASLALLSVTFAMSSQARLSKDAINARLAAEQIAERASVYGCGLQTGAEVSSVIVAAKTRCNTALELGDGVILGDVSTSVTRKNVVYSATFRNSWLPGPGADALSAVTCTNLQSPTSPATFATMTPTAIKRITTVTWKFGIADGSTTDKSYILTKYESVPPDAAAYSTSFGRLIVTGMTAAQAVDLQAINNTSYKLRRYATIFSGDTAGTAGCAWFAYLPAGSYKAAKSTASAFGGSSNITITNGATTQIAYSALP